MADPARLARGARTQAVMLLIRRVQGVCMTQGGKLSPAVLKIF